MGVDLPSDGEKRGCFPRKPPCFAGSVRRGGRRSLFEGPRRGPGAGHAAVTLPGSRVQAPGGIEKAIGGRAGRAMQGGRRRVRVGRAAVSIGTLALERGNRCWFCGIPAPGRGGASPKRTRQGAVSCRERQPPGEIGGLRRPSPFQRGRRAHHRALLAGVRFTPCGSPLAWHVAGRPARPRYCSRSM